MSEIKTPLTDAEVEERTSFWHGSATAPELLDVEVCREIERKLREELTLAKQALESFSIEVRKIEQVSIEHIVEIDSLVQERDQLKQQLEKARSEIKTLKQSNSLRDDQAYNRSGL